MPARLPKSVAFRRILSVLLLFASITLVTAAAFRLQSYFFAQKVRSVLSRMGQIQLDKTSQTEVVALLPEFKPGTPSDFLIYGVPHIQCSANACYGMQVRNWPGGMIARLQEKLNYRFPRLFEAIYKLGHRYLAFAAFVEIRGGTVSRCLYVLGVQNGEFPANDVVSVAVFGGDRADFLSDFGSARGDEVTRGFRGRVPGNKPTTDISLVFTPDANVEDVRNAFDIHVECVWNTQGCWSIKQLLPLLWKQHMESEREK